MNDMELAEEIGRLVALSEKATQGKWSSEDGYLIGYPPKSRPNGEGITQFHCAIDPNFPRSHADGEFVAALVNWFRANIAALRRGHEHDLPEYHDKACYYCHERISAFDSTRGPGGCALCHADEPGVVKWHHSSCVSQRLCERPPSGEMVTVFLVDGKEMKLCACSPRESKCPRGFERRLCMTEFSRCLLPR